jgi:hypothetical protein
MPSSPRQVTSLDVMLLVASAAAGFSLVRVTWPGFWPSYGYSWPSWDFTSSTRAYVDSGARQAIGAGPPVLLCLTFGYLAVRLRGNRPPLRRLARQVGTAACLATLPPLAMMSVAYAVVNAVPGRVLEFWYAMLLLSYLIGPAVAGAWVVLALSGRLRAPRDWVEGLGSLIGACWVALTLLALYSLRR